MDNLSPILVQTIYFLAPIVIISIIFIFLIFRPQYKKINDHKKFISELKVGDSIVTSGGVIGTIKKINGEIISLEISNGVEVEIIKNTILEKFDAEKFKLNN